MDSEEDNKSNSSEDVEIVWAKIASYPWWPAGVSISSKERN